MKNERLRFVVIGVTDCPQPFFPPEVLAVIRRGRVFSGGRRHHEIVASLLPAGAEWIDITVPLDAVFERYHDEVVVFASGDPLFFGFANTIRRRLPDAAIRLFPAFNSLQLLAHRLLLPYHDMRIVSLTGRPWPELDRALIERTGKIGVLTDREHTPAAMALRMLEYGYTYYNIYVGEHLGHPALERVSQLTLEAASQRHFEHPNCVILVAHGEHGMPVGKPRRFGIPDSEFALLDGREKMITKMPIRLLTLQALDLPCRRVLWDIGACTGSVSIEARLQFPSLQVEAFEIRPECDAIIRENMRRHGAPGIGVHIGDFLNDSALSPQPSNQVSGFRFQVSRCKEPQPSALSPQPSAFSPQPSALSPDAVFIGGHGGRLKDIMAKVLHYLTDDGCIVMNSVKAPKVLTDSHQLWDEACRELNLRQEPPLYVELNEHHPITILKCRK